MARLVFRTQAGKSAIELGLVGTIGQGRFNTIQVLDRRVAINHCALLQRGDRFLLRNTDGSHGLSVNAEPVETERMLDDRDEITIGATEARFEARSTDPPGQAQPVVIRPSKLDRPGFPELTLAELRELANKTDPTDAEIRTAVEETRRLAAVDYLTFHLRTLEGTGWALERLASMNPDGSIALADIQQATTDAIHGYFSPPVRREDRRATVPSDESLDARAELSRQMRAVAFPCGFDEEGSIAALDAVLSQTTIAERNGSVEQFETLQDLARRVLFGEATPTDALRSMLFSPPKTKCLSEAAFRPGGNVHHFRSVSEIAAFCRAIYGTENAVHRAGDADVTVVLPGRSSGSEIVSSVRYIERSGSYLVWLPDP